MSGKSRAKMPERPLTTLSWQRALWTWSGKFRPGGSDQSGFGPRGGRVTRVMRWRGVRSDLGGSLRVRGRLSFQRKFSATGGRCESW